MNYPRIYQLETTNYCQARCDFCPRAKMKRSYGLISLNTVQKVLSYCKEIGQDYIALHHMGEPLIHQYIDQIVYLFESSGVKTEFSSNGFLLAKMGKRVLEAGLTRIRIAVDYYYADQQYIKNLKSFLLLARNYETEVRVHTIFGNDLTPFMGYNAILENKSFDNWAGAIKGESQLDPSNNCYFRKYNYVVVLFDGRVVPCCMDFDGKHVIGTIDTIRSIGKNKATKLCRNCVNLQFAEGGEWRVE